MRRLVLCALLLVPGLAAAQDSTLADIRQELGVLLIEVQALRTQLSTTGAPVVDLGGTDALARIDAMEAELRRLTGQTEAATNRIEQVVADAQNRIGDLQFRACEADPACDIGAIGTAAPLGGVAVSPVPAPAPLDPPANGGGAQMAIGEQADFDRAKEAFDSSSFRSAATLFETFAQAYTGGPLTAEAHLYRGRALEQEGDAEGAARAYLDAFSGAPGGPDAPEALLRLGLTLDTVGQRPDACATLGEVTSRFPASDASVEAQTARASLACP